MAKTSYSKPALPLPLRRAVRRLGLDIAEARKKRRITTVLMAERAGISRPTLAAIEKGKPTVSLDALARVLFVLGLHRRLEELADPSRDEVALALDAERLPKRVRHDARASFGAKTELAATAEIVKERKSDD